MPFLPRGLLWRSYSDCWFIGAQYTRSPLIFTSSTIGYRREGSAFERRAEYVFALDASGPARTGSGHFSRFSMPPLEGRVLCRAPSSIRNHTELTCYLASREGMCMSSRSTENLALAGPYLPSQDDLARFQSASVNVAEK